MSYHLFFTLVKTTNYINLKLERFTNNLIFIIKDKNNWLHAYKQVVSYFCMQTQSIEIRKTKTIVEGVTLKNY